MQKVVVFAVTMKHNIPRVFIKERHQNDDIKSKALYFRKFEIQCFCVHMGNICFIQ